VWALHASPQATQADSETFLRTLDVSDPPKLVITDGNAAIGNAVRAVWPAQPRHLLPAHYSTAALDTALGTVRDFLDSRSFVRHHLDAAGGVLPPQRGGKDTGAGPRTDRGHRTVAPLRR
jgi:hypothetical protein